MSAGRAGVMNRIGETLGAEVSSRSLGLMRIFICIFVMYRFNGLWSPRHFTGEPLQILVAVVFLLANIFCLVGYQTKVAKLALGICVVVGFLYLGQHLGVARFKKPFHPFHMVLLLALTPCGRSCSVDRWLAVRRARREGGPPPPERVNWLLVELFVLQICVMYVWAGYDKLDPGWLSGERLERTWMDAHFTSDALGAHPWLHPLAKVSSWGVTATELGLPLLLVVRRFRPWVMWWGVAFHLAIYFTLNAPDFTMMVLVSYISCLSPRGIDRVLEDLFAPAAEARDLP